MTLNDVKVAIAPSFRRHYIHHLLEQCRKDQRQGRHVDLHLQPGAGGQAVKLHQMMLAPLSPLLSGLSPPAGPLTLLLPGVSSATLHSLVTLLYTGRLNASEKESRSLVSLCSSLGLTDWLHTSVAGLPGGRGVMAGLREQEDSVIGGPREEEEAVMAGPKEQEEEAALRPGQESWPLAGPAPAMEEQEGLAKKGVVNAQGRHWDDAALSLKLRDRAAGGEVEADSKVTEEKELLAEGLELPEGKLELPVEEVELSGKEVEQHAEDVELPAGEAEFPAEEVETTDMHAEVIDLTEEVIDLTGESSDVEEESREICGPGGKEVSSPVDWKKLYTNIGNDMAKGEFKVTSWEQEKALDQELLKEGMHYSEAEGRLELTRLVKKYSSPAVRFGPMLISSLRLKPGKGFFKSTWRKRKSKSEQVKLPPPKVLRRSLCSSPVEAPPVVVRGAVHSRTFLPWVQGREEHEDCWTGWEERRRREEVSEFIDITGEEKDFFTIWNQFLQQEVAPGLVKRHLAEVLVTFVRERAGQLHQHGLYTQVVLHVCNLQQAGLIHQAAAQQVLGKLYKRLAELGPVSVSSPLVN